MQLLTAKQQNCTTESNFGHHTIALQTGPNLIVFCVVLKVHPSNSLVFEFFVKHRSLYFGYKHDVLSL